MAKKAAIPLEIRAEVERIVEEFNERVLKRQGRYYVTRYKGRFLYLDRSDYGRIGPVCRLEYTGNMKNWNFAIFRFSSGTYDTDTWFFPGFQFVDGTVNGAMKAGIEAYT